MVPIDKNAWLNEHNARRASEGGADMQQMVWSEQLQQLAEGWAVNCKAPSTLPTPNRPVDQQRTALYEETSENMFWSTGQASPSAALDKWHTSVSKREWKVFKYEHSSGKASVGLPAEQMHTGVEEVRALHSGLFSSDSLWANYSRYSQHCIQ